MFYRLSSLFVVAIASATFALPGRTDDTGCQVDTGEVHRSLVSSVLIVVLPLVASCCKQTQTAQSIISNPGLLEGLTSTEAAAVLAALASLFFEVG